VNTLGIHLATLKGTEPDTRWELSLL